MTYIKETMHVIGIFNIPWSMTSVSFPFFTLCTTSRCSTLSGMSYMGDKMQPNWFVKFFEKETQIYKMTYVCATYSVHIPMKPMK